MTTITTVEPLWALWLARCLTIAVCGFSAYWGARVAVTSGLLPMIAALRDLSETDKQHNAEASKMFAETRKAEESKVLWMAKLETAVNALETIPTSVGSIREDVSNNSALVRDMKEAALAMRIEIDRLIAKVNEKPRTRKRVRA